MNKFPRANSHLKITYVKEKKEFIINDYFNQRIVKTHSNEFIKMLKMLDGKTNPYNHFDKLFVDRCLEIFKKNGLTEDNDISLIVMKALYKPKIITEDMIALATNINNIIMICWVPLLLFGLFAYYTNPFLFDIEVSILNSVISIIICLLIHELGHILAALSYNPKSFYEFGIGVLLFFIPFGYAAIDYHLIKKRWQRIQMLLAGVEMNFILFSISVILYLIFKNNFIGVLGINSLMIGILNTTFFWGSDGSKILLNLLSIDDEEKAKKNISFKIIQKTRFIGTCCLIGLNIWGISSWFLH